MALRLLRQHQANNLAALRKSPISEISGALGDLGTLLPLMIALAVNGSISLSSTLVFSGLWNISSGVLFGIPLPVQPMKAIAAVAISRRFSIAETISAGFTTAGVVFMFSVSGLLEWFTKIIPIPVIKGIQLGAGLSLIISAGSTLLQPLHLNRPSWHDNLILALIAFLFLLATSHSPSSSSSSRTTLIPTALIIFLIGTLLSTLSLHNPPTITPYNPLAHLLLPAPPSFIRGALEAGIGQIPLTTLNSIIAIPSLSHSLLPHLPVPSTTSIGLSVSLMNLLGGWFGAMPVCHGSGGLAGQYHFGARSGASVILLGLFKLFLGLVFGESLLGLLQGFPKSLLGIMVIAAGLELAKVGEGLNVDASDLKMSGVSHLSGLRPPLNNDERKERWTIMLMTVAGILAFKNDGVGFAAGMLCHFSYRVTRRVEEWRVGRRSFNDERRALLDA